MQFYYSTSKVKVTIHVTDVWEIFDWSATPGIQDGFQVKGADNLRTLH
jgi:hypothetical protein